MRPPQSARAALVIAGTLVLGACHAPKGVRSAAQSAPGGASGPPRPGGPETRVKLTLGNGMRVVLEESHATPTVALQAWVAAGAADDPPDLPGAAHLFEHLLVRGTPARATEAAGGALRAWTTFDETVFEVVVAAPYFDAGVAALAGVLQGAAFEPADVERARTVALAQLQQGLADPARAGAEALLATAFAPHPYGRPVMGTEAGVRALGRDPLAAFFRRAYGGANVTLVVVGDFDAAAARAKIETAFAAVPRGTALPARPRLPDGGGPRVATAVREVQDTELLVGFRIPAAREADLPALDLLAAVLGQGDSGRLGLELVRNRQLARSARAYTFSAREAGLLVLAARLPAGRADEASRLLLDEALRLGREEIPPEELARARTALEGDLARARETAAGYARRLGFFATAAGDAGASDAYLARLRALTAADLRAAAARHLRSAGVTVAAIVPASALRGRAAGKDGADLLARLRARLQEVAAAAETRAARRAARAAGPVPDEEVVRVALASGTRVLVLRDRMVPLVSVEAVWPGGLREEDGRTNGISSLVAELLPRGTRARTADQIAAEVEGMAGTISGFAGRNSLGLRAEFLASHWERGLELAADCLRSPSFSDDEVERQRRVLLDRIRMRDDAEGDGGGRAAFRLFAGALWKRHPYRLDPLGTPESLASLTRRRLIEHYRRRYPLSGLTVAVVGDVDPEAVVAKLESLLGDAPRSAAPSQQASQPPQPEPAREEPGQLFRFVGKDQAHVVIGYPGLTFTDPDRFALEALAQILGGPGGRLPAELRDRRGLAFRADASSIEGIDPGAFTVYAACPPERLDAVVQAVRTELARVVAAGVTPDETGRAARALAGAHALALQRRSAVASAMAAGEAHGQGWDAHRLYGQAIARVTAADVQRAARRILDDKRQVVAVIKPPDETPALARGHAAAAATGGGRAPAP